MNHETFENRLRRQPWRPLPESWRKQILERAALVAASPAASPPRQPARWQLLMEYLLWPSPRAWAAVAALWMLGIVANGVAEWTTDSAGPMYPIAETHPGETLPQRQRVLAEWLNQEEPATPPITPRATPPRGEGRTTNRLG